MDGVNEIEVMANTEPSPEAHQLLRQHCGLCNGTCDGDVDHVWRIEVALLRQQNQQLRSRHDGK